ncbi:hypothetical protein SAMN06269185_2304 [Natronoarchaeum philippinense]|uniref:N-acetyltransferase domain-containing protein n=1 Tax=Natronoarchaeum philippinense TaxID=558529 RepID=A0A285NZH8_NATPI|nr:hypothetical protein [Natronoarchaeum philippinense]SNZ14902.1 hypothetical protein SAMN06269185_2304 [Natronoarchaeum philippinense]
MEIRDAVEADADDLAAIADSPVDVMRNLVHDRTVRVAEPDGTADGPNADADDADENLLGFVSFDAKANTVHVTQLDGTGDACKQLLGEPIRFARQESMSVELLAPDSEPSVADAAEELGFQERGRGPRFDGTPTVRYQLEP